MARWIAGVDGCRKAWAVALMDLDDPGRHRTSRVERLSDLLDGTDDPRTIGIDVPIGLPDRTQGGRLADREARRLLGRSRSSVFPVPPRAALDARDYETAKRLARENSDPPRAVSIQCYNILPYVREVDGLLRDRPALRERVYEVHPELVFFRLNGDRPLHASKMCEAGLEERRALLSRAGLPAGLVRSSPPSRIGRDDHLDALAALVCARAIALGHAVSLPATPERDRYGLPVAIWMPGPTSDAVSGPAT